jgi:hypothetical protein
MAHVVVRIIELLLAIGLTAAVTGMFALAVISVVHGLHTAGRQRLASGRRCWSPCWQPRRSPCS